ncbi:uncharacterized protein LOC119614892 [Lucilia sericata]|uniref:uncharacterized protein LOC119614892 n=1 Tax=Lucilia sericata TaxID=13632 RepID=UPI0018A8054A|nr:uncharacterized protein LOC119614892 [Lucilia sericata]
MVEGDSQNKASNNYNVETGLQPNDNNTTTTTVDNRSILQPYGLVTDSKDPGYHINEAYENDKNDVEKGGNAGRSGGGLKAGFEQAIEMCGYGNSIIYYWPFVVWLVRVKK